MKRFTIVFLLAILLIASQAWAKNSNFKGNTIFSGITEIIVNPTQFDGKLVSLTATFEGWQKAPGRPPVTRSDWVVSDEDGKSIYCTGAFPENLRPGDSTSQGRKISILGRVHLDDQGNPFIKVSEALSAVEIEQMVSVSQILFDPIRLRGKMVGLLGVLAKGFGSRGNRLYLLADPTGAITIEKMPKLYPKGTILQIRGIVSSDENGLPRVSDVEILSARN